MHHRPGLRPRHPRRIGRSGAASALLGLAALLAPALARAQQVPLPGPELVLRRSESPFDLRLDTDLQLAASTLILTVAPRVLGAPRPGLPGPASLSPQGLNPVDRGVVQFRSSLAGRVSDLTLGTAIILPFAASLLELLISTSHDGLEGALKDSVVMMEALTVAGAVVNMTKLAVGRPRPYTYNPTSALADRLSPDATQSFFSGHTAMAFAMASSYSYLFSLRHEGSSAVVPVAVGTHLLAASTAALRVLAGMHFNTDVLVGAGVGSAVGVLVPSLHRRRGGRPPVIGALADLKVLPMVSEGGYGLSVIGAW